MAIKGINYRRQAIYAAVLAAAVAVAYLLASFLSAKPEMIVEKTQYREQPVEPWYRTQSPPPEMITEPDQPLFRETAKPPPAAAVVNVVATPRWRRFAVAAPAGDGKPMIAIVIDDMGVDRKRSARAMDLKGPLTLSFLAYAGDLAAQTAKARAKGHELMLHLPMEPGSKAFDPGPNALLTGLSEKELRRRLEWGLGRFSTYVGVNNHMGSKFTSDNRAMAIVIREIKRRGLLYMDSRTSGGTVGAKLARQMGVPVVERDIFIDHDNDIEAVKGQLRKVEELARRKGLAVAIGHPRKATIKALDKWLAGIEGKGFRLVTLSAVVMRDGAP